MVSKIETEGARTDKPNPRLLSRAMNAICIKGIYLLLQFVVSVVLARLMGPEALGMYAFVLANVYLFSVFGQMGVPMFVVRTAPVLREEAKLGQLRGLPRFAFMVTAFATSCIIGTLFSLGYLGGIFTPVGSTSPYIAALVLIPLLAFLAVFRGVAQGFGRPIGALLPEHLIRPILLLAGVLVIHSAGVTLTASRVLNITILATVAALVLPSYWLWRVIGQSVGGAPATVDYSLWLRRSLPFLFLAGAQLINYQTDIIMLGLLTDQTAVGLYRVAIQIAEGFGIVLFGISFVVAPHIAELQARKDLESVRIVLVNSHRAAVMVLLLPAILTVIFASDILTLVFGGAYLRADNATIILVIGKVAYASIGFVGLGLSMLGRADAAALITGAVVCLNIALNWVLIPGFGIEGAAFATTTSSLAVNAIGVLWLRRVSGHHCSAFARLRVPHVRPRTV